MVHGLTSRRNLGLSISGGLEISNEYDRLSLATFGTVVDPVFRVILRSTHLQFLLYNATFHCSGPVGPFKVFTLCTLERDEVNLLL